MSLLDWFTAPKKSAPPPAAAVPTPGAVHGRAADLKADLKAELKAERARRRERLYQIVRESMVRAGVLSSSYKFKVMALDPKGQQFLVLLDLAPELDTRLTALQDIESLICSAALSRHQLTVSAVYWRCSSHTAPPPQTAAAGAPTGAATPAATAPVERVRPAPSHTTPTGYESTEIIESRLPGARRSHGSDEETQILDDDHGEHPTPALGPTQYGDLR